MCLLLRWWWSCSGETIRLLCDAGSLSCDLQDAVCAPALAGDDYFFCWIGSWEGWMECFEDVGNEAVPAHWPFLDSLTHATAA